jgi:hypothetical protein
VWTSLGLAFVETAASPAEGERCPLPEIKRAAE